MPKFEKPCYTLEYYTHKKSDSQCFDVFTLCRNPWWMLIEGFKSILVIFRKIGCGFWIAWEYIVLFCFSFKFQLPLSENLLSNMLSEMD